MNYIAYHTVCQKNRMTVFEVHVALNLICYIAVRKVDSEGNVNLSFKTITAVKFF